MLNCLRWNERMLCMLHIQTAKTVDVLTIVGSLPLLKNNRFEVQKELKKFAAKQKRPTQLDKKDVRSKTVSVEYKKRPNNNNKA